MLSIIYGDTENVINRSDIYFNSTYQDEWFEDELIKNIILDVDKSSVVSSHLIESSVLGPIGPKDLSGEILRLSEEIVLQEKRPCWRC